MLNLTTVITQLTSERDRISKAIQALQGVTESGSNNTETTRRARRRLSAATRAKMAAAQRARWVKAKSGRRQTHIEH